MQLRQIFIYEIQYTKATLKCNILPILFSVEAPVLVCEVSS